jgi:hypothetical protein
VRDQQGACCDPRPRSRELDQVSNGGEEKVKEGKEFENRKAVMVV